MYVLTTTHLLLFNFHTMENLKNKNSPPKKEEFLKLNSRAWEYIKMLDDDDAWMLIKMMLNETVWIKNEELTESVFSWSKELQMAAMMRNEHLFDN